MSIVSFSIACDSQSGKQNTLLQIGYPEPDHNPLDHQSKFLSSSRGISIPSNIMESLQKIYKLAIENNVDFGELAEYALKEQSGEKQIQEKKPNTSKSQT